MAGGARSEGGLAIKNAEKSFVSPKFRFCDRCDFKIKSRSKAGRSAASNWWRLSLFWILAAVPKRRLPEPLTE